MTEREAMALLVSVRGIGYVKRRNVLRMAGSAAAVMAEPERYSAVLGAQDVEKIVRMRQRGQQLLDEYSGRQIRLLAIGDEGYPDLLRRIAQPPHLLFVLGRSDLRAPMSVAIVGTREASEYGKRHAREIAGELARSGAAVVSGLALGIDTAAHRGTVDAGGYTIAVLGGAFDRFYPAENRTLMQDIISLGGSVVSEYPLGVNPDRHTFLQRNRIVAGLSMAVLVIEGALPSGAMSTANHALDEGRELFALPGDVDRPVSALPNLLIGEGARPITCARDILTLTDRRVPPLGRRERRMQMAAQSAAPAQAAGIKPIKEEETPKRPKKKRAMDQAQEKKTAKRRELEARMEALEDENARRVLAALAQGEQDFDTLCAVTGLGADVLGGLLVMLELDEMIEAKPGLRYALL